MKALLLHRDGDLLCTPSGMQIGETLLQDAAIVLACSQGEIKEDPLLGAGLMRYIRSRQKAEQIKKQIKLHITRAGLNYEEISRYMHLQLKRN